ncbi:MAG: hypothetical protein Ta2D_12920 [Rickettsiales bacterium]|nr:MAG: hypothetical protein Ta2D_12920 [Rickettsiales bacterium]
MLYDDYLIFRDLSELEKYANEHNIFSDEVIARFEDDYIRGLQSDDFNPHYYINKKYGDKTPLELYKQRNNYFNGLDKLWKSGIISLEKADEVLNEAHSLIKQASFAPKEKPDDLPVDRFEKIMNTYHGNLMDTSLANQELIVKKINNVILNQSALEREIDMIVENDEHRFLSDYINDLEQEDSEYEEYSGEDFKDDANFMLKLSIFKREKISEDISTTIDVAMINQRTDKVEQQRQEFCRLHLSPEKKDYVKWITEVVAKKFDKKFKHFTAINKGNEWIKKLPFSADYEKKQIQALQKEEKDALKKQDTIRRSRKWFSNERKEEKDKLDRLKREYTQKRSELYEKIRQERLDTFNEYAALEPQELQKCLTTPITNKKSIITRQENTDIDENQHIVLPNPDLPSFVAKVNGNAVLEANSQLERKSTPISSKR